MPPDACEAVRLQFHFDGKSVHFGLRRVLLQLAHFGLNPQQLLHVMADFMRDNVALSKITVSAKLAFHVIVKREIDIDGAVCRAVERPHHRLPGTASGAGCAPVHHQLRLLVGAPHLLELLTPCVFSCGENNGGKFGRFIFIRADGVLRLLLLQRLTGHQTGKVDPVIPCDQHHNQQDDTALAAG